MYSPTDLTGLKTLSEEGARFGYTGKQIIHPSQIDIVQEAFLPSKDKIAWASQLLEEFAIFQSEGKVSWLRFLILAVTMIGTFISGSICVQKSND